MIERVINQIHRTTHLGYYKKAPYSEEEASFVRLHGLSAVALLRLQHIGPETGIAALVGTHPDVVNYVLSRVCSQVLYDRELPMDNISLLFTYFLSILDINHIGRIIGMDPKVVSESVRSALELLKAQDTKIPTVMREAHRPQELRTTSTYRRLVGLRIPFEDVTRLLSGSYPDSLDSVKSNPGTLRIVNEILPR